MATEAQIAANCINAQASCGPRTAEGRARVSRNAVSHGLFSSGDFVRPNEQTLSFGVLRKLSDRSRAPGRNQKKTLAAEIVHAAWRLRRYLFRHRIYALFLPTPNPIPIDKTQQSVDRARAHAHRIFHRSTAELRRVQTERQLRDFDASTLGLASCKDIKPRRAANFTEQTQSTGRNSPCTCGSGVKFKRCCGKGAPAVLNYAA